MILIPSTNCNLPDREWCSSKNREKRRSCVKSVAPLRSSRRRATWSFTLNLSQTEHELMEGSVHRGFLAGFLVRSLLAHFWAPFSEWPKDSRQRSWPWEFFGQFSTTSLLHSKMTKNWWKNLRQNVAPFTWCKKTPNFWRKDSWQKNPRKNPGERSLPLSLN